MFAKSFSRLILASFLLAGTMAFSVAAQAGVICSFTGSGTSGTDCLGQAWSVGSGGWGIPGIGNGVRPFAGSQTASDFHFHCLTGCGPINNAVGQDTQFSLAPFGLNFWLETLNGAADTIDFLAPIGNELTPGRNFFVNITVPITLTNFSFEASWTNRLAAVPEPASLALLGLGLAGLGFSPRQQA